MAQLKEKISTSALAMLAAFCISGVEGYEKDTLQHKANKRLISKLVGEYNAYKKSKLLRFRFSSKASSTMFGKSELKSF